MKNARGREETKKNNNGKKNRNETQAEIYGA